MRASLSLLCVLFVVGGCNKPRNTTTEPDSGIVLPDAGSSPTCGDPGMPYGTSEGANFRPFTLPRCNGPQPGSDWTFYDTEVEGELSFCEARFSVVSIAAGWCVPCQMEAALMEQQLVQAYADQGVRVAVALIQDPEYNAPSADFCQEWVDRYGLTNPVMMDAEQDLNIYFPGNALPATLIVDSHGVIRFREYGLSENLESVRSTLDALLAE